MPWEQSGDGYTKAHTRHGRGGFVRNPRQYEKLRRLGMSKERAAAITNSDNRKVSKMSNVSAFGVDHGYDISKAAGDDVDHPKTGANPPRPSGGRQAAGTVFGAYHSAAAGKKGKKLAAVGSSMGHSIVGSALGSAPGAIIGAATRNPELGAGLSTAGSLAGGLAGSHRAVMSNQAKGRYKPEQ